MIPIYCKTADFEEPSDPIYHLLTRDGVFLVMKNGLFTTTVKVDGVPQLESQQQNLELGLPKLPRGLMERIYGFFQAVYDRWEAEGIVLLYYSQERREYSVAVPSQTIYRYALGGRWRTEGRVSYGYLPRPEGFVKLGDAHSHGDLPAFHSCTDDRDDREDGLRIVFGDLDRPTPSVAVSFVAAGRRFRLEAANVLEDVLHPAEPPVQWMRQISCEYERPVVRLESAT